MDLLLLNLDVEQICNARWRSARRGAEHFVLSFGYFGLSCRDGTILRVNYLV
jgi:hypothetical protein